MTIRSNLRLVAGVLVTFGAAAWLAGCETAPQVTSLSTTQVGADIALAKGTSGTGLGVAASQLYAAGPEGTCEAMKLAADLRPLSGKEKVMRAGAGAPLYVYALTTYVSTSSVTPNGSGVTIGMDANACTAGVSFVPEAGHTYLVQQKTRFGVRGCDVHVTDRTTGAEVKAEIVLKLVGCKPVRGKRGLEFH